MSLLSNPFLASAVARGMQGLFSVAHILGQAGAPKGLFPEHAGKVRRMTIPTAVAPAPVVVYAPESQDPRPPVHVNFHGGGYILRGLQGDDALCRFLAAEAEVVVVNVDYAVAPQHPFPAPTHQAFEVVRWVAEHGEQCGWDGGRLSIGGQSAGGGLAAAVARQALEQGGPPIALQVLHYPPLDLATPGRDKRSVIAKPLLRPWMAEIFDNAYVPDPHERFDRLVSPANAADTADLRGIAPALVITAEFDLLRAEGQRYAHRLSQVGALVEHRDVAGADHGYDLKDFEKARDTYSHIARIMKQAVQAKQSQR
jgi:acetyl esterase